MIGLDDLDNKILKLLGKSPSYPSGISKNLGVLRTTIQYRLKRLQNAGLINKNLDGKKSMRSVIFKNERNKNNFKIYKGPQIIQAYEELLKLPRQTMILSIQGSDAAKNEFYSLPELFIKQAIKTFKNKKIAMKGISNERAIRLFDKLDKAMIESHIGRTQGLKMFSGDKFLAPGEIMSTDKLLLLSNPKSKYAIVIKDKGLTKIVNNTLEILFELLEGAKSFDLNDYLKNVVKKV